MVPKLSVVLCGVVKELRAAGILSCKLCFMDTMALTHAGAHALSYFKKCLSMSQPTLSLEVKSENFLEYMNSILATGEVVGLFQKDCQAFSWKAKLSDPSIFPEVVSAAQISACAPLIYES